MHTFSHLRDAQDRARRGVKYAVGVVGLQPRKGRMCVSPGEAKDLIEEEATCASLLGSPPLGYDTHGGTTTKQSVGEEAGESSFLPVL